MSVIDKEKSKELATVMLAFAEGKECEWRWKHQREINLCGGDWKPVERPDWDFSRVEFRIKPEPPKPDYLAGHKASGLKVGDLVRVTREAASKEGGWNNCWIPEMSGRVKPEKIIMDYNDRGFHLENGGNFPFFVLEKVEPLEWWVNVYEGYIDRYTTEEEARKRANKRVIRIAVHVREVLDA